MFFGNIIVVANSDRDVIEIYVFIASETIVYIGAGQYEDGKMKKYNKKISSIHIFSNNLFWIL